MEGTVGIARASTITYQTHRSNGRLKKKKILFRYPGTCKGTVGEYSILFLPYCSQWCASSSLVV